MTEIIVVRHGQANSQATDEESYDRLSDLGRDQARWLGDHLSQTNPHFDLVLTGTQARQADTAKVMGYTITKQDPRLNELNYFVMAKALEVQHGIPGAVTSAEHAAHLPKLLQYWSDNHLVDLTESFQEFTGRVSGVINDVCQNHGRVLIVTSTGVIGAIMRHVLGLSNDGMSKVMLQTMNSSMHRLEFVRNTLMVATFNATPHLDGPDRAHARTHV